MREPQEFFSPRRVSAASLALLASWLLLEMTPRLYVEWPLETDFYGSIGRDEVRMHQERRGVQVATGLGWAHLGWIAHPDVEQYRIERAVSGAWDPIGRVTFGSYLVRVSGTYRVWAEPLDGAAPRLLGTVAAAINAGIPPVYMPRIAGPWRTLFRTGYTA